MSDVFPRRNLNPDAEQWGREIESHTTGNAQQIEMLQQSVQGQNRNNASSLSLLSQQIDGLRATQALIPVTSSRSAFTTDFTFPSNSYTEFVRVDVPNPLDRRELSILCIGSVRFYEDSTTPITYSQSIIRIYDAATNVRLASGGSSTSVRDARPDGTLHSGTPFQASNMTTPVAGIYVTLEILVENPAAFISGTRNLAQLAVQTSFL